ncbi:MAG: LamG domain-containing protein [Deltaproteobacteria bacterium]|nr:LamG domain-containing protein [Deltaproteobacteria bacterium]
MSRQKVLEKDPVGYQDWTLPVSIVGQVIEKLKVDIVAQTLANLNVDIAAQSLAELNVKLVASEVTLNVAITSCTTTLDVSIVSQAATLNVAIESCLATLDVNIASSAVTLNVAITSSSVTLDVNVTNASLTVNIGAPLTDTGYLASSIVESVQLDVNIASSAVTLDVNIASSAVTLNVAIQSSAVTLDVNIASSAVTLDINVTNPVLQVGQTKPCLAFDGVDDYVDTGVLRTDLGITTEYTIVVWFKPLASGDTWRTVIGDWAGVGSGRTAHLGLNTTGVIDNYVHLDDTQYQVSSGVVAQVGVWYCVASVLKIGEVFKIYLNGELKGPTDVSGTTAFSDETPTETFKVGNRGDGGNDFAGVISQVLIYNRALSDNEIQQIYQNPQSPVTNGLVLWLNFDEGSGTTAHDKSGNGNDGTIYGATWVSEAGEVPALVNVNLSAQTVTLEVKIVASDVTLNVAIQSSAVTLDVNITGSSVTLDVNIVGTANVNITDAIVNISALNGRGNCDSQGRRDFSCYYAVHRPNGQEGVHIPRTTHGQIYIHHSLR